MDRLLIDRPTCGCWIEFAMDDAGRFKVHLKNGRGGVLASAYDHKRRDAKRIRRWLREAFPKQAKPAPEPPAPAPRKFAVGDRVVVVGKGGRIIYHRYKVGDVLTVVGHGASGNPDCEGRGLVAQIIHADDLRLVSEQYPRACKFEPGSGWYSTKTNSTVSIVGYVEDGYKLRFLDGDCAYWPCYDDELTPLPAPWPVEVA